jgi:hypothetical protein
MKRLAILAVLALIGCSSAKQATGLPSTNPRPYALKHADKQLDIFDAAMIREAAISRDADQRPTWVVSGRIRNHTTWFVDTVWIEVQVWNQNQGAQLDSTVIKMENLRIPPNDGVVSFSRSVRIMPPASGWTWTYSVINSLTEPLYDEPEQ